METQTRKKISEGKDEMPLKVTRGCSIIITEVKQHTYTTFLQETINEQNEASSQRHVPDRTSQKKIPEGTFPHKSRVQYLKKDSYHNSRKRA